MRDSAPPIRAIYIGLSVEKAREVIIKAIRDAVPTPPVRLNPDVPPKLEDIIHKALEKPPSSGQCLSGDRNQGLVDGQIAAGVAYDFVHVI